jgi:hypothetical protein
MTDWAEQRTEQRLTGGTGSLAAALGWPNGRKVEHLHTPRGELESSDGHELNSGGGQGAAIDGLFHAWAFDPAGNRFWRSYKAGGSPVVSHYTVNALNQYTDSGRQYDLDGNLSQDATWWYWYDGENRLSAMQRKDGVERLEFLYDYMGRRIEKTVRTGWTLTLVSRKRFVYDGWNVIAEIDAHPSVFSGLPVVRTFAWGLDLSGSVHGAGGVGGLLLIAVQSNGVRPRGANSVLERIGRGV